MESRRPNLQAGYRYWSSCPSVVSSSAPGGYTQPIGQEYKTLGGIRGDMLTRDSELSQCYRGTTGNTAIGERSEHRYSSNAVNTVSGESLWSSHMLCMPDIRGTVSRWRGSPGLASCLNMRAVLIAILAAIRPSNSARRSEDRALSAGP